MLPIFNEYIQFLKDNNVNLDLQEGYYWINNQVIRFFTKKGREVKIAKIQIDDNLNMSAKQYRIKNTKDIESWQETIERHKDRLIQLEHDSLDLIKMAIEMYPNYTPYILFSGGKDSIVTAHLVKQVYPNAKLIFNNTSLDCPDTYKYIKSLDDITIINPNEGFYQWVRRTNVIPSQFLRVCCKFFKEDALLLQFDKEDILFFLGMRNSESQKRAEYGDFWINETWARKWEGVLPIRKWSDEDIWLYILWKGLHINTKYKKGYQRVGCAIACPYYSKSTWALDRYWYPTMYNRWQDILKEDFIKNNKWIIMNCTLEEYKSHWNGGIVRETPTKEVIQEFAQYNNLNEDIAQQYFNKHCKNCGKKIKDKETLSMNLKFNGRNTTTTFYCKKHLQELLNISEEKWAELVEDFKSQQCILF